VLQTVLITLNVHLDYDVDTDSSVRLTLSEAWPDAAATDIDEVTMVGCRVYSVRVECAVYE